MVCSLLCFGMHRFVHRPVLWALSAVLLCVAPLPALGADTLVADMQRRYDAMQSFSAAFTQTLTHRESGSTEQRSGTMLFRKPLQVRWETGAPSPELLVVTEKDVWNYLPDEELAYRYAPEVVEDSRSAIRVITGRSRLDKDFDVEREKDENGLAVLRLYPKEPTAQLVEALLWVDPQTRLIRRVQLTDFYGNTNDIAISRLTPNAPVPADAFAFAPPSGVEVEDLRDAAAPSRPLLQ